jgi:glutamate dehydrogenase
VALRGHIADLLRAGGGTLSPSQLREEIGETVAELVEHADSLLGDEARAHVEDIAARLADKGAPRQMAETVAQLFAVDGAIGMARLATDTGIAPLDLASAFVRLGSLLGIDWAQSRAAIMTPSDPWERLLVAGLARDFQAMRFDFLRSLARKRGKSADDPLALIEDWAKANEKPVAQFRRMIGRAQAASPVAPAMLAQVAS